MTARGGEDALPAGSACLGVPRYGLTLYDVKRVKDEVWWCSARLEVPGMVAEKSHVSGHYAVTFDDLIAFVEAMAEDWRGWEGKRVYESLEGDLRLEATHPGGSHVELLVTLTLMNGTDDWRASAALTLEPGAQMARAAADVRALLAV